MKTSLYLSLMLSFSALLLAACTDRNADVAEAPLLADDDELTDPGDAGDPDDVDEDFIAEAPPVPKRLEESKLVQLLSETGFPKKTIPKLVCTAKFESHFDPAATNLNRNGTQDTGLFQINDVWLGPCGLTRVALLDPSANTKCALQVWKKQGLTAWTGFKRKRRTCMHYRV